jgi:hypothetical protein
MTKEEFFSRSNAQYVAIALNHVIDKKEGYAEVELVSYRDGEEVAEPPIYIRLRGEDSNVVTLANSSEIAQCITDDGQLVSIMLGKPKERVMQPARIILGPETSVSDT